MIPSLSAQETVNALPGSSSHPLRSGLIELLSEVWAAVAGIWVMGRPSRQLTGGKMPW